MSDSSSDDAARKEQQRERSRRWREANLEKHKEQNRQWYLANRERIRAEANQRYASDPEVRERIARQGREWQMANRSRWREYQANWYKENSDQVRERVRRRADANREAIREDNRKRYAANPAKWHADGLKRKHGLDDAGWARMWEEQEGLCYLCHREMDPSNTRDAVVEHWHGCSAHGPKFSCSGCRRGLACNACNVIVGMARDNPELLRVVADNLEKANAVVQVRQASLPRQLMLGEAEE
jgi:hypothetical protein